MQNKYSKSFFFCNLNQTNQIFLNIIDNHEDNYFHTAKSSFQASIDFIIDFIKNLIN